MAMTKAEQAEMEALRTKLALRWSGERPKLLPLPAIGSGDIVRGWDFNPHRSGGYGSVYPAWTGSSLHGNGHDRTDIASQGPRPLYATKREALIALRLAKEEEFAGALRAIDVLIESEP